MENRNSKEIKMAPKNTGIKPTFLTGANAKVLWNGITLAYAANVSYAVATPTIPVEVMGRYEVVTHEPVSYFVSGSMDIVRYTKQAKQLASNGAKSISHASDQGNRPALWAPGHFNPALILNSMTCDIDIFQKFVNAAGVNSTEAAFTITDCRMTSRSAMLDKRGVWFERYTFDGILLRDEGLADDADYSGDNDLEGM